MGRAWMVTAVLLCAGCAAGTSPGGGREDARITVPDAPGWWDDGWQWPDLGALPDAYVPPDGPLPHGDTQAPPPDAGAPQPDAQPPPCKDGYESNETCTAAKALGTAKEGSSWVVKQAMLDPAADTDWYSAKGEEKSHTCLPFTSQCYYFKVRLQVPTGRKLRLCLRETSCSAAASCNANSATPGPTQLEVKYKVKGQCAFNDDTDAKITVENVDGQGGCDPYTLSFNYDEC